MFRFFRIERPTTRDLAAHLDGDVDRLLHAVDVRGERRDRTRPWRRGMIWRNASPTSRSEPVTPGRSAFVESPSMQVDAAVAELGERPTSVREAVDRRVVELPVAACGGRGRPASRATTATASGIECATRTNSTRNGPISTGPSSGLDLLRARRVQQPVLVELRLDEPEREPRAQTSRHRDLAQEVRQRADVVLVRVREHDGADRSRAVGEVRRSPGGSGRRRGARRAGRRVRRRRRRCSPSSSKTVMFLPTSPRPPSGMIRSVSPVTTVELYCRASATPPSVR